MMERRTCLAFSLAALVSGCAAQPLYTKTATTWGEVDTTGLVCRRAASIGSSIPKTVCASQAVWDRQDAAESAASARMREEANRHTNVDLFGRGRN